MSAAFLIYSDHVITKLRLHGRLRNGRLNLLIKFADFVIFGEAFFYLSEHANHVFFRGRGFYHHHQIGCV